MIANNVSLFCALVCSFNSFAPERINEVSLSLEGIPVATIQHYYPIISDKKYLTAVVDEIDPSGSRTAEVLNQGSHIKRIKGAGNPVMLFGAFHMLNRSVRNDARYVSLAAPVSNLNKILGFGTAFYSESGTRDLVTVKSKISTELGHRFYSTFNSIVQYIQGTKQKDYTKGFAKSASNYYGSLFRLNFQSGFKQLSAIFTKCMTFGKGYSFLGTFNLAARKDIGRKLKKYSSVYVARLNEGIDVEMARLKQSMKERSKSNKLAQLLINAPVLGDTLVMHDAWATAEFYVSRKSKQADSQYYGLVKGTDEFYKAVAELFNEHIINTQPTSTTSTLSVSQLDGNIISRTFDMFQSASIKMHNAVKQAEITYEFAKDRLTKARRAYNENPTAETEQALEEAKKEFKAAKDKSSNVKLGAFLNLTAFVGLSIAWKIWKMLPFGDEEDEETLDEMLKEAGVDAIEEMATVRYGLPARMAFFLFDTFAQQKYGSEGLINDPAANLFNDAIDSVKNIVNAIAQFKERVAGDDTEFIAEYKIDTKAEFADMMSDILSEGTSLLKLAGIPTDNISKIAKYWTKVGINVFTDDDKQDAYYDTLFEMPFVKNKSDKYVLKPEYLDRLYYSYTNNPEGFVKSLDAYINNPWTDAVEWMYGNEGSFEISKDGIVEQIIKKDKKTVADNVEEIIKQIYINGDKANIDNSLDGEWTVKVEYDEGRAHIIDEVSTISELVKTREKLQKLYGYDIFEKIIGKAYVAEGEKTYPEGISTVSTVRSNGNKVEEFLIEYGLLEPKIPGSGKQYAADILNFITAGDEAGYQAAAEAWNYAYDNNDDIDYNSNDEDKNDVMADDVVSEWRSRVSRNIDARDNKADGLFYRIYKWKADGKENKAYATTIAEMNQIEDGIEKGGYDIEKDVAVSTYYRDDYNIIRVILLFSEL